MKLCPVCSFSNEECYPACIWCNASIVDVESVPCANPESEQYERETLRKVRHAIWHRQTRSATVLYSLAVTLMAAIPGLIFVPHILLLYLASAFIVAWAIHWHFVGQLTASLLQGAFSVTLLAYFGPLHPLIFFMLLGHVLLPFFCCHWMAMIDDINR